MDHFGREMLCYGIDWETYAGQRQAWEATREDDVLAENARMPRGDAQQGDRETLGPPPALLPVPEGAGAAHREDSPGLKQTPFGSRFVGGSPAA